MHHFHPVYGDIAVFCWVVASYPTLASHYADVSGFCLPTPHVSHYLDLCALQRWSLFSFGGKCRRGVHEQTSIKGLWEGSHQCNFFCECLKINVYACWVSLGPIGVVGDKHSRVYSWFQGLISSSSFTYIYNTCVCGLVDNEDLSRCRGVVLLPCVHTFRFAAYTWVLSESSAGLE